MTNAEEASVGNLPTREAIEAQLARILNSGTLSTSDRSKAFLAFVVRQSLLGKGAELKELVIGTELFGQSGFDPKRNSSVRSAANRLRAKLGAYYAGEGCDDDVVILLPEGAYVPRFSLKPLSTLEEGSAKPPAPARSVQRILRWVFGMVFLAIVIGALFMNLRAPVSKPTSPVVPKIGRLFAESTSEGKAPTRIDLGYQAAWLLVKPGGRILYAIEQFGRNVTEIGVDDLRITRTFHLPHPARGAALSGDGKHLYIGSPDALVMIVDTTRGSVERTIPTGRPVFDLTVTPDEKKIFLAMASGGLKRILTASGEAATLSEFACPLYVAMDGEGKRLFVSYQCGGPGGRAGHDAVEIYDTASERTVGVIRDLPMVGGRPSVSPDGKLLLLDGNDACINDTYDHAGCPEAPGRVFHLVRISDLRVLKSFSRRNAAEASFLPDGSRLIFGGAPLVVMDWARQTVEEIAPIGSQGYSVFAFSREGARTFAASSVTGVTELLVFDMEKPGCGLLTEKLVNHYSGDGTFEDSVGVSSLKAAGAVRFAPGLIGQAFQFNGTGALEGSGDATCWPCEENWTESFFAKFNSIDGEMTLLDRGGGGSGHWRHRIFKTTDNHLVLQVGEPSAMLLVSGSAPAQANRWYHVAVVSDTTRRSFYIDGVLQGYVDLPGPDAEPGNRGLATFGASRGQRAAFHGLIDEIAWHERALDAREVMTLAQSGSRSACWVALRLDRGKIDWEEVRELVTGSYQIVAPKRLLKELL
jgi:hypothetical protein